MSRDDSRRPSLIGICHVSVARARLLGDLLNKYIKPGTVGRLEIIETSCDGRVIHARFYPEGSSGFGLVTWPEWEYVKEGRS